MTSAPTFAEQLAMQRENALQQIIGSVKVPRASADVAFATGAGARAGSGRHSPGTVAAIAPPSPAMLEQFAPPFPSSRSVPVPVSKAARAQEVREKLAMQVMASVKLPGASTPRAGSAAFASSGAHGPGQGSRVRSQLCAPTSNQSSSNRAMPDMDRPVSINMHPDLDGSTRTIRPEGIHC